MSQILRLLPAFILIIAACGSGSDVSDPAPTDSRAASSATEAAQPSPTTARTSEPAPSTVASGTSPTTPGPTDVSEAPAAVEDPVDSHEAEMDETGHESETSPEEHIDDHGDAHEPVAIDPGDTDRVVEVVMTEFAFSPATISVASGETIRFAIVNEGFAEHEFRVTTMHAAEEHIEGGHGGHGDGHHDEMVLHLGAGESGIIDVAFAKTGTFDLVACLLPGHFEAGMTAPLHYTS